MKLLEKILKMNYNLDNGQPQLPVPPNSVIGSPSHQLGLQTQQNPMMPQNLYVQMPNMNMNMNSMMQGGMWPQNQLQLHLLQQQIQYQQQLYQQSMMLYQQQFQVQGFPQPSLCMNNNSLPMTPSPIEIIPQKIWVQTTIEVGSTNRQFPEQINSYILPTTTMKELKLDIIQQLHNMQKFPTHQFKEYLQHSRIQINQVNLDEFLSFDRIFTAPIEQLQVPVQFQLLLIKCKIHLSKRGYSTKPRYQDLQVFTEEQLSQVEDFQIQNENGLIFWPGKSDIRFIDLDEIVSIHQFEAEVYKGQPTLQKPQVGDKLNKHCYAEFRVTYDSLRRNWGCQTPQEIGAFLYQKLEQNELMFVNDDPSNNCVQMAKEYYHFSMNEVYNQKQI